MDQSHRQMPARHALIGMCIHVAASQNTNPPRRAAMRETPDRERPQHRLITPLQINSPRMHPRCMTPAQGLAPRP
jgi:hypothetical protein